MAPARARSIYTISPQNSTAFGAAITIDNTGATALTSWTLTWSFANGQTVSSLWNGIETQSGANVTVKNETYNGSIAAGGSLTGIGFNGTWNGVTNAVPTSFAINGTACGGAATGELHACSLGVHSVDCPGRQRHRHHHGHRREPVHRQRNLRRIRNADGRNCCVQPSSSTSSSVLTLTVASTTVAGNYPITITGTSGTLSPVTTSHYTHSTGRVALRCTVAVPPL